MILNPPLRIGAVEVTSVNEELRSIHLMVHIFARREDVNTPGIQLFVGTQVQTTCQYLISEGFISGNLNLWLTHIGAILHTPK